VSEQFLNGTSAHIRLFTAIHSFSAEAPTSPIRLKKLMGLVEQE